MLTFYLCFLAGGIVLPLISFIMGSLSNGADAGLDTDVSMNSDLDIDPGVDANTGADTNLGPEVDPGVGSETMFSLGLIPTSFLSISALAIIFGAVGAIMTRAGNGKLLTLIIAALSGYFASVVVQTLIKSLKKIQTINYGIDEKELMLYDGKVIETILPDQLGAVSFVTLKNIRVSYPARCADKSLKLSSGKIVKVVEYKNGIFIVEPKNKYEQ